MAYLSEAYISSICEIKSMSNDLIGTGRINKITKEYIEITNHLDKMPLVGANKIVKIGIHNEQRGFQVLVGTVYLSTDEFLRLVDVESIAGFEKRDFYRIKALIQASCYYAPDDDVKEDPNREFFKIDIHNLSLSGVYFTVKRNIDINQKLALLFPLSELQALPCKILRKEEPKNGIYGYGCEFAEYSEKQADLLCRFIFAQQRCMIRKAKQYDS